jgi:hypothetical protein
MARPGKRVAISALSRPQRVKRGGRTHPGVFTSSAENAAIPGRAWVRFGEILSHDPIVNTTASVNPTVNGSPGSRE